MSGKEIDSDWKETIEKMYKLGRKKIVKDICSF